MQIIFSLLLILLILIPFAFFKPTQSTPDNCQQILASKNIRNTSQVLILKPTETFHAEITACELKQNTWQRALSPFPVVIGKKGIAPLGKKKEGDLKTPAGLYALGEAFGSQALALNMDYKYITPDDKFIDDVNSPEYNRWVHGKTNAKSYEPMLIAPYKMGIIINYNKKPTIKNAGSAIFMHVWRSSDQPTHGCVAMNEQHLLTILHWLDKKQHPSIYITQ